MKKNFPGFFTGMLCGALLFGSSAAYAAGVLANPSTHHVTVNGQLVETEAYTINGSNYFKLRDIGQMVDFGVTWNSETRTVEINTDVPYRTEEAPAVPADGHTDLSEIREEIVRLTNELRQENGLSALDLDPDLMAAAQVRAEEAAATLFYRHERPDGSAYDTVIRCTGTLLLGENMGMKDMSGKTLEDLPEIQVNSWAQSSGHRSNMLHTIYHSMGVGISRDKYGMYYLVQLFAGGAYTVTGIDDPILIN